MRIKLADLKFDKTLDDPDEQKIVQGIADSFSDDTIGQLQAIEVSADTMEVVIGRRRCLAAASIGWTEIDAELVSGISAQNAIERSAHENLKRKNLPWYMVAELTAKLHEIRQAEKGVPRRGRRADPATPTGWGVRETARELEKAIGVISEDISLAKAVAANPRLKNIKDRDTAIKLVKMEARKKDIEDESSWDDGSRDDFKNQIYCGSSADILAKFPKEIFDLCITDPPWIKYIKKELTKDDDTSPVFKELFRVMKKNSLIFIIVGVDDFIVYKDLLPKFGFEVCPVPMIWHKHPQGVTYGIKPWQYNRDYELIMVVAKGDPILNLPSAKSSVLTYPPIHPKKLVHPNEKPVELIRQLISDATFDKALIVDPFGGSGVVGDAAKLERKDYTIIERDQKFYDAIVRRLKNVAAKG